MILESDVDHHRQSSWITHARAYICARVLRQRCTSPSRASPLIGLQPPTSLPLRVALFERTLAHGTCQPPFDRAE